MACRSGHGSIEELQSVLANYAAAGLPLEALWSDASWLRGGAGPTAPPPQELQASWQGASGCAVRGSACKAATTFGTIPPSSPDINIRDCHRALPALTHHHHHHHHGVHAHSHSPPQQAFVEGLHSSGQQWAATVDPSVPVESGTPAFDEGLQRGLFLQGVDGDPYLAAVSGCLRLGF